MPWEKCKWTALAPAVLLSAALAAAADHAELRVTGFSADGGTFAFEQYGVQDGLGFPYSEIFVVDVAGNSWVPGTPIRTRLEDEAATLATARDRIAQQAAPQLDRLGFGRSEARSNETRQVVGRPLTDRGAVPDEVTFVIHPSAGSEYTMRLTERGAAAPQCDADPGFDPARIFSLDLTGPAGETLALQRDRSLPQSRNCAFDYRIADIYLFGPQVDAAGFGVPAAVPIAVLLNVIQPSFEGADSRFLAVTGVVDLSF